MQNIPFSLFFSAFGPSRYSDLGASIFAFLLSTIVLISCSVFITPHSRFIQTYTARKQFRESETSSVSSYMVCQRSRQKFVSPFLAFDLHKGTNLDSALWGWALSKKYPPDIIPPNARPSTAQQHPCLSPNWVLASAPPQRHTQTHCKGMPARTVPHGQKRTIAC